MCTVASTAQPTSHPLPPPEAPVLRPPEGGWRAWRRTGDMPRDARLAALRLRQQWLSLSGASDHSIDLDAPLIASGHQPGWWHMGIVAKWWAAEALAHAARAGQPALWIVVDQDVGDVLDIAYPTAQRTRAVATIVPVQAQADAAHPLEPDVPLGVRPALRGAMMAKRDAPGAWPAIDAGLDAIADAFARTCAASLASQVHASAAAMLTAGQSAVSLSALALARTELFAVLVEHMARAPRACVENYNRAVRAFPHAGMRPLAIREADAIELPLWWVAPGQRRRAAYAHELASGAAPFPNATLAPRALTMTALARAAGCDLFIHGLGGGHYDHAMERWWQDWLRETPHALLGAFSLSPSGVVSATRTLPLASADLPTPAELRAALWRVHAAQHNPALLGDHEMAQAKQRMLAELKDAPRRSSRRAELYRLLHALLLASRSRKVRELAQLEGHARELHARAAQAGVLYDRTWSFAFHDAPAHQHLRESVHAGVLGH